MDKKIKTIQNLRLAMGTEPSTSPKKRTRVLPLFGSAEITLEDHSNNPYKAMFLAATSTWGDNEFKQKWPITSLEGKLEVIKAVLTNNTLPQAKEPVMFFFRVKGVPRWLFDYHTTVKFTTFMSIGCRDNNKLDADIVSEQLDINIEYFDVFKMLKDLYEDTLNLGNGSWQSARAFLPQSYSHSYHFSQNLLSIVSMYSFHANKTLDLSNPKLPIKLQYLGLLYIAIINEIREKFPLIALYLETIFNDNDEIFEKINALTVDTLDAKDLKYFKQL